MRSGRPVWSPIRTRIGPSPSAACAAAAASSAPAASGKTFDVMKPATDEVIAKVPDAGPKDVEAAVAAARRAFESWRDVTAQERGRSCTTPQRKTRQIHASEYVTPARRRVFAAAMIQRYNVCHSLCSIANLLVHKVSVDASCARFNP